MQRRAFTLIELLVVISIIALLIGILLPALGAARRTARQMQNSTQLRGIHQAMFTFAQSNKSGGSTGYYPGRDSKGGVDDLDDVKADNIQDGSDAVTAPASDDKMSIKYTFAKLLAGDYFTPEYCVAPSDATRAAYDADTNSTFRYDKSGSDKGNVSYATAVYSNDDIESEWQETTNTQAIIATDRIIDSGSDYSSIWTDKDSKDWRGTMTHNDGSTGFEASRGADNVSFGNGQSFDTENVFGTTHTAGNDWADDEGFMSTSESG